MNTGIQIYMTKGGYVYILASQRNGTLYIGVTSDLTKRVWQHKEDIFEGFSKKYNVHSLVWFQRFERIEEAIIKEKQLKKWKREWKLKIIEEMNPGWIDLFADLT